MRGVTLIDASTDFEKFVDLVHGKQFKHVKPGSCDKKGVSDDMTTEQRHVTTSVTPEVFILQVDLLTSCMTADAHMKSDQQEREVV